MSVTRRVVQRGNSESTSATTPAKYNEFYKISQSAGWWRGEICTVCIKGGTDVYRGDWIGIKMWVSGFPKGSTLLLLL